MFFIAHYNQAVHLIVFSITLLILSFCPSLFPHPSFWFQHTFLPPYLSISLSPSLTPPPYSFPLFVTLTSPPPPLPLPLAPPQIPLSSPSPPPPPSPPSGTVSAVHQGLSVSSSGGGVITVQQYCPAFTVCVVVCHCNELLHRVLVHSS